MRGPIAKIVVDIRTGQRGIPLLIQPSLDSDLEVCGNGARHNMDVEQNFLTEMNERRSTGAVP